MADNQQQQQVEEQQVLIYGQTVQEIVQEITDTVNTPVVSVREETDDGHPWINFENNDPLLVAIAGRIVPIYIQDHFYRNTNYRYAQIGEGYKVLPRTVDYDNDGRQRYMIETSFPDTRYRALFTFGITGCTGGQAQLDITAEGWFLYIIDEPTALGLRNQCVTRGNQKSLVYQLVRSAYKISIMANLLYQWILGVGTDELVINLRREVFEFGEQFFIQMRRALRAQTIYKKAIVVVEAMDYLVVDDPQPPLVEPLPAVVNQPPDINDLNVEQVLNRVIEFVQQLVANELFTRNWQQIFNELANQQTSVPIGLEDPNLEITYNVRLVNYHIFPVRITLYVNEPNDWKYVLNSASFHHPFEDIYELIPVEDWEPVVAMRNTRQRGKYPLHSHGLAGSYHANIIQGGLNGCQVMTLNFPEVEGLNEWRLYFVNRAMAQQLKGYFESENPVMDQYHQWFSQLVERSRDVCDLILWHRQYVQQTGNAHPLLPIIQQWTQNMFELSVQLYTNYQIIERLEQVWNFSLLVANRQNGEQEVQNLETLPGVYSGKKSTLKLKQYGQPKGNT